MVFLVRTAVELHRAWHLTLLTSKVRNLLHSRARRVEKKEDLSLTSSLASSLTSSFR